MFDLFQRSIQFVQVQVLSFSLGNLPQPMFEEPQLLQGAGAGVRGGAGAGVSRCFASATKAKAETLKR